jgi:hypothetical protein
MVIKGQPSIKPNGQVLDTLQIPKNDHDDCQQTHFCMVLPADKKSSTHCGEEGSILWPGKNHLFCVPEMSDLTYSKQNIAGYCHCSSIMISDMSDSMQNCNQYR